MSSEEYYEIHWLMKQINLLLSREDIKASKNKKAYRLIEKSYWDLDAANRIVFENLRK